MLTIKKLIHLKESEDKVELKEGKSEPDFSKSDDFQVKFIISKLVTNKHLKQNGTGRGTYYTINNNFKKEVEELRKKLTEKLNTKTDENE